MHFSRKQKAPINDIVFASITTMDSAADQIAPFPIPAKSAMGLTVKSSVQTLDRTVPQLPQSSALTSAHTTPTQNKNSNNQIVTPIKVEQLKNWLRGYDPQISQFLTNGFKSGFKIPFTSQRVFMKSKNLKSASENLKVVKEKIQVEIEAGRVAGPFRVPNMHISPLGLIPKKTSGDFRIIQHLSYPEGKSINDGIPKDLCSVQYQNIDHAVALVKKFGKGSLLSKTDIKDAFRLVPIFPGDYELLGFCIEDNYYYDKVLAQGLSYSCALFETFSTSLQWMVENKLQISGCAHILDDFLFVGPSNYDQCLMELNKFLTMAKDLGIPIKQEKTVLPCTTLSFVGIEIDSILMEKRLPSEKLTKISDLLEEFKTRKK